MSIKEESRSCAHKFSKERCNGVGNKKWGFVLTQTKYYFLRISRKKDLGSEGHVSALWMAIGRKDRNQNLRGTLT